MYSIVSLCLFISHFRFNLYAWAGRTQRIDRVLFLRNNRLWKSRCWSRPKSSDSVLDTYRLHLTKEDNRSRGRNRESWQEHVCGAGPPDTHCHKSGISLTGVTPQPASAECITYQTSYQDSASWFMWLKGHVYIEHSDAHHGVRLFLQLFLGSSYFLHFANGVP